MTMKDIDKRMPILTEQNILNAFTDEELREIGEEMGYIFPKNVKFHENSNQSK